MTVCTDEGRKKYPKHTDPFFVTGLIQKKKKKTVSSFKLDKLNGLIQKIDSKEPRGTLKPNYSIPQIVAKRVISAGLICINYSFIIPADHSNYTVLFDLF